jgi:hypothetical protein
MTAPAESLVSGDTVDYPVYGLHVQWTDSGDVGHHAGFEIRYAASLDPSIAYSSPSVEDAEAFLTALGVWASTYAPAGGTGTGSVIYKITQSESTLYSS